MTAAFTVRDYDEAAQAILACTSHRPTVGLVLGSGLSGLADAVEDAAILPYGEIPHFPVSTVPGHRGRLVIGRLAGMPVCVMQGRLHFYEGYSMQEVTLPMRVMRRMGVTTLILTNAAGGLNPAYHVGDLMLLEDHLFLPGMAGHSPLRGPNLDEFGPRFPAVNRTYTRELRELAQKVAVGQGLPLLSGVYAMVAGPNFESPAEIRWLRQVGADAVGMSTVPEAIVARHADMRVLAVSTITNVTVAQVDAATEPSDEEVQAAAAQIVPKLTRLLMGVLERLAAPK